MDPVMLVVLVAALVDMTLIYLALLKYLVARPDKGGYLDEP